MYVVHLFFFRNYIYIVAHYRAVHRIPGPLYNCLWRAPYGPDMQIPFEIFRGPSIWQGPLNISGESEWALESERSPESEEES